MESFFLDTSALIKRYVDEEGTPQIVGLTARLDGRPVAHRPCGQLSESLAVTVFIEWQDVQIAKGETTLFGGDQVTRKED